jgi:hypothetical protein
MGVTAPSGLIVIASTVETRLPQLGQELRAASRLVPMRASRISMSTCGSTSRRRSPRAPLVSNVWRLTKEAQGLLAMVRGIKRTNTPSMQRLTSHAGSTTPPLGRPPTSCASAASSRSSSSAPANSPGHLQSSRLKIRRVASTNWLPGS